MLVTCAVGRTRATSWGSGLLVTHRSAQTSANMSAVPLSLSSGLQSVAFACRRACANAAKPDAPAREVWATACAIVRKQPSQCMNGERENLAYGRSHQKYCPSLQALCKRCANAVCSLGMRTGLWKKRVGVGGWWSATQLTAATHAAAVGLKGGMLARQHRTDTLPLYGHHPPIAYPAPCAYANKERAASRRQRTATPYRAFGTLWSKHVPRVLCLAHGL